VACEAWEKNVGRDKMAIRVWLSPRDVCALMATQSAVRRIKAMLAQSLQVDVKSPELLFAMASFSKFYSQFYNSCVSTQDGEILDRHRLVKVPRMVYLILKSLGFCIFQTEEGEAPLMGPGGHPVCVGWNLFGKKPSDTSPPPSPPQENPAPRNESQFQIRRNLAHAASRLSNKTNRALSSLNQMGSSAHANVHKTVADLKTGRASTVQNAADYYRAPAFDRAAAEHDMKEKYPGKTQEWINERVAERENGYKQRMKTSLSAVHDLRSQNIAGSAVKHYDAENRKRDEFARHHGEGRYYDDEGEIIAGQKKCTDAAVKKGNMVRTAESHRCDVLGTLARSDLKKGEYERWGTHYDTDENPHPYVLDSTYHVDSLKKKTS